LPYRDFHARRAFQPPQPRRRDREVYAPGVIVAPVVQTGAPAAIVEPAAAAAEAEEKAAV